MKKSIIHNLSWLLICSLIAKLLGGVYRVVLTRILGIDIGLYQIIFSTYSFLVILSSSGIPLAISKLISSTDNNFERRSIIIRALSLLLTISGVLAILLCLSSKSLSSLQGNENIFLCYIILAPSLILSSGIAILKGYLQGIKNFQVPAISTILEQLTKVCSSLIFIFILRKYYILGALFGAIIGTTLGDLVAFIFLKILASKNIKFKYSFKEIVNSKEMLLYAYPIMLYSLIIPFSNFIDSFLVVKLLKIHLPNNTATLLFGLQNGAIGSLITIPSIFAFSLASVLMPSLSTDFRENNINRFNQKASLALKLAIFISLPCAIFFAINSSNIINLLYGTRLNGYGINGQYIGRILLSINSISVVFLCLNQLSAVILQNLDKKFIPILNLVIGIVCKFAIEVTFIPCKRLGIFAYALSVITCLIITSILNLYAVKKYGTNIFKPNFLFKAVVASAILITTLTIFKLFNSTTVFILGSLFSAGVYLISCYVIKLFSRQEIKFLFNNE